MAIARSKRPTKTKSGKAPARRATAARSHAALDDVTGPERSAPQLAEVDADALEFIAALDRFKKEHGRPFPSWSEVLLVLRQLGYRRD